MAKKSRAARKKEAAKQNSMKKTAAAANTQSAQAAAAEAEAKVKAAAEAKAKAEAEANAKAEAEANAKAEAEAKAKAEAEAKAKAESDRIFTERLQKHHDELRWLYMELYGNDDMFAELCSQMKEYYDVRNEKLKALDAQREAEGEWYRKRDMLGMMMYIDNFAGDIKGVEAVSYTHLTLPTIA